MDKRKLLLGLGLGLSTVATFVLISEAKASPSVERWKGLAYKWGTIYKVPPNLILAVIHKESSGNPMSTSNKGAIGLMQLMPDTARALGLKDIRQLYNPEINIKYGTKYLADLISKYGIKMALQRYYAGSRYWLGEKYAEDVLRLSKLYV